MKEKLWSIFSWVYLAGLAVVVLGGIIFAGNEWPIVITVFQCYLLFLIGFISVGGMLSQWDDFKDLPLARLAKGVNWPRLAWWNITNTKSGYLLTLKNICPNTVNFILNVVDDIMVLLRDVGKLIMWLAVSVLLVTGLWLFYQLYKIPRMARATVQYKANMEKVIRKQWPLYAAQQKYAKKNAKERERIRYAFRMMYKLPDDSILLSMENSVLKGR